MEQAQVDNLDLEIAQIPLGTSVIVASLWKQGPWWGPCGLGMHLGAVARLSPPGFPTMVSWVRQ